MHSIPRLGKPHGNALPWYVVAIRWDYEYALMSAAAVVEKYRVLVGKSSTYDIIRGNIQPLVKAQEARMEDLCRKQTK